MVKPGYKQTEIGVLPESWDTITFEKCFTILLNNTLSRAELNYNGGEVQNIHYGDILVKFPAVLDCSTGGLPYINKENVSKASKGFLRDGDLIMADTAEDVIVGKSTEVIGIGDSKVVSGLHTIPCRPKDAEMFAPKWLGYFINHCTYHDQLIPYITGIKVSSVSKSAISNTVIAVPPKSEQKAIAEALSDIDALIVNLEKLIAKKKAIKQGAMQELLTGKRRLPGFDGEWKTVIVGEICNTASGGTPSRQNEKYYSGNIPWFTTSELTDTWLTDSLEHITNDAIDNSAAKIFATNTILMAMYGATIGKLGILKSPAASNQACCALMCKQDDFLFLFYKLMLMRSELISLGCGAGQPNISQEIVKALLISLPEDINEQKAISEILSHMDAEIASMVCQLKKYQGIRNGLMSELLTGRIRLIDKDDA